MIPARERFNALLFTSMPLKSDAVVVLCGEDGLERMEFAYGRIMAEQGAKMVVLSGGINTPDKPGAKFLFGKMMGRGIPHQQIIVEDKSTNTKEQAANVVEIIKEKHWRRVILVASPYHASRAYLTFLKALQLAGVDKDCQLVSVAAIHLNPFGKPKGNQRTREELFIGECGKIAQYQDKGDVASYEDGIEHFRYWAGK